MSVRLTIAAHYQELYGVDGKNAPAPRAGESIRAYIARAGLGREEDILPVVGDSAQPFGYCLKEGDELTIYPLAASG